MSGAYEYIINLMCANGPGSSTLNQHCSAMRMDSHYAFTANSFISPEQQVQADIERVSRDPVADLNDAIASVSTGWTPAPPGPELRSDWGSR
jgi:hypothetical protein